VTGQFQAPANIPGTHWTECRWAPEPVGRYWWRNKPLSPARIWTLDLPARRFNGIQTTLLPLRSTPTTLPLPAL